MPKPKNVEESGQVLEVPSERLQRQPITVSYSQAKQLAKREMTEKQAEHVKKLVEANRKRWEEKKQAKEQAMQEEVKQQVKQAEEAKKRHEVQEVVVLPKRVYKSKKQVVYESEEEEEEQPEPVKPKKQIIKQAEKHIEAIQKIDAVIKQSTPQNRYLSMLRF